MSKNKLSNQLLYYKKLTNHIYLSGITVSLLFSPLMAINPNQLPSGGKFTHGTTGSININGNTMNINGTTPNKNHVIQWGGGFNIGKDAQVHFGKGQNGHNYLNIAHGTSKSTIAGLLNANGNNVFLINPNGVIITKTGTINANRFVASTSSMDSAAMQNFANMNNFNDGLSFSPVFKPNKLGNVVNMGNIKADNITLQGNKVVLGSENYNNINKVMAKNIKLEGNEVYVDVASIDGNTLQGLNVDAKTKGNAYLNANGYYYNPYSFSVFSKISGNNNFKKDAYVGIGSDVDWWHFAKGWNENKAGFRTSASEYRLTKDIDFGGNNNKNYANYCIDGLGCTSMIVGYDAYNGFTKTFDGQGYTLKNINIDTSSLSSESEYVGIFGYINDATIKNINVDYMGGGIRTNTYAGGFAGSASGTFSNISLNNIGNISGNSNGDQSFVAGFAGFAGGTFSNISLNNIGDISGYHAGGFAGWLAGIFTNISLHDIGNISGNKSHGIAGGFAGSYENDSTFKNIYIFFNPNAKISGRAPGKFFGQPFWTAHLNNIHIYHSRNDLTNAITDRNYWGNTNDKIQIHTYNNSNQQSSYQDFLSKANTISRPTPPSNPTTPPNLTDTNVKLDENDLHQNIVNEIINDITNNHYEINIANLLNMLKEKTNYTNMNEEQKANFIAKYFLKGNTTKALEVVQSLDFLLAYENNGLSTASNDKFEANGLSVKNTLVTNTKKVIKNKNDLFDFLSGDLKNLVVDYNQNITDLKTAQEQLKTAIAKYNDYVKKVNENPSLKNDATLNSLKAEVDRLNNLSKELFASINDNQELLQTWQSKTSTDSNNHFKIKGEFKNLALLTPNLDEVIVNGNENEDYKKVSRQVANAQKQTPTFEYEENEKEEVEETALMQKGKICIVSDNFKTMNPCIVRSF
ncbi:two-partner secretion domain-containing protein [Campylobacter sp. RM16704]|uniref:two-partner secretion domain-containing protein n=1 Tax=Campylobacter sp. RM16704 TaxID=1500960 RepID=UPI0005822D58|nr:filamentous hemagglutinin N-terminal domain-containing protein [Campylobacter sp. RM16704]AJC85529.1 hemagglutinin domain-containing protein [Campylobacter sp. RM16704]